MLMTVHETPQRAEWDGEEVPITTETHPMHMMNPDGSVVPIYTWTATHSATSSVDVPASGVNYWNTGTSHTVGDTVTTSIGGSWFEPEWNMPLSLNFSKCSWLELFAFIFTGILFPVFVIASKITGKPCGISAKNPRYRR